MLRRDASAALARHRCCDGGCDHLQPGDRCIRRSSESCTAAPVLQLAAPTTAGSSTTAEASAEYLKEMMRELQKSRRWSRRCRTDNKSGDGGLRALHTGELCRQKCACCRSCAESCCPAPDQKQTWPSPPHLPGRRRTRRGCGAAGRRSRWRDACGEMSVKNSGCRGCSGCRGRPVLELGGGWQGLKQESDACLRGGRWSAGGGGFGGVCRHNALAPAETEAPSEVAEALAHEI